MGKKEDEEIRWTAHTFQQKLIFHHILIMQLDIFKVIRETTGNHSLEIINASCFYYICLLLHFEVF